MRGATGGCRLCLASLLCLAPCSARAYRPFVSTDAAVADPGTFEIELGYLGLERDEGETTVITPQLVVNYGVVRDLELVGEFELARPNGEDTRFADPKLSLKRVLREGALQGRSGLSVAAEAGPLLPSNEPGERQLGFEGSGIVSGSLAAVRYHLNLGGGVARDDRDPFALWGMILELPLGHGARVVGEINGERVRGGTAENSGLLGAIWEPDSLPGVALDVGLRRRIGDAAPDWGATLGLTFGF